MKSILLSSVAVVGFAGMAAADGHLGVTFTGDAELGFNENPDVVSAEDDNDGFYSELDVTIGFAAELDNGLTAAASIDFEDLADGAGGNNGAEYELSLTSETAGLFFGDTDMAAITKWTAAGDMEQDGFSETDGEGVLRGDISLGGVDASISYIVFDTNNDPITDDSVTQLSLGVAGSFGSVDAGLAYQEEIPAAVVAGGTWGGDDLNVNEILGVFASTSFGGADVTFAYADQDGESSTGIQVGYPIGPVTATVYYVDESNGDANFGFTVAYEDGPVAVTLDYDDDQGTEKVGLEGSYDVGNGLVIYAGYLTEDNTEDRVYVGGEYDLGGGASLLVSYADDESDVDEDEIGAQEYQGGTTVEVSFEF